MPIVNIESIDDPRIADYRALNTENLLRTDGRFVVEGKTLVERLLKSDFATRSILTSREHVDQLSTLVPSEVPIFVAVGSLISQIVGFRFHRGALACGQRRNPLTLAKALGKLPSVSTVVVCPETLDPANLGSIVRNCHAFGVAALVLGPRCADPFSRRVVRVSMGAALLLPIVESSDVLSDLRRLRDQWLFEIAATVLDHGAQNLNDAQRRPRLALVFGSEADDVDPIWLSECGRRVTLPMCGGSDSLNVATASGIFLYHFTRVAAVDQT